MNRYILRKENFGALLYDREKFDVKVVSSEDFEKMKNEDNIDIISRDNENFKTLSAPIRVFLVLTKKCNLKCIHCSNNSGFDRKEELSYEEVKNLLLQFKEMGVFEIAINGGEPLSHPDFFNIIKLIKDNGFPIYLNTNGVCIIEKLERLSNAGIEKIKISLDGLKNSHDYIRGKGTFVVVINTIKYLISKCNHVRINYTLMRSNKNDCLGMIKLADELGCDIKIAPMVRVGRAKLLNNEEISIEEGREIGKQIKKFCEANNIKIRVDIMTSMVEEDCSKIARVYDFQYTQCGMRRVFLSIDSDGAAIDTSCQTEFENFKSLGNIRMESIAQLWRKAANKNEEIIKNERCKNCDVANLLIKSLGPKIAWWEK